MMNDEKNQSLITKNPSFKVPEIRFKGFGREWEVDNFKNLTKINQGLQIAISNRYIVKVTNRDLCINGCTN